MESEYPATSKDYINVWSSDDCSQHETMQKAIDNAQEDMLAEDMDYVCICKIIKVVKRIVMPDTIIESWNDNDITKQG